MIKTKLQNIDFSSGFNEKLAKAINPKFETDEIKCHKVGKQFSATFKIWKKSDELMNMETTITKPTLSELELAIISFIS